jgi:hypothetical protein
MHGFVFVYEYSFIEIILSSGEVRKKHTHKTMSGNIG